MYELLVLLSWVICLENSRFANTVLGQVGVNKTQRQFGVKGQLLSSIRKNKAFTRDPVIIGKNSGVSITLDEASELKNVAFGGANFPLESQVLPPTQFPPNIV